MACSLTGYTLAHGFAGEGLLVFAAVPTGTLRLEEAVGPLEEELDSG